MTPAPGLFPSTEWRGPLSGVQSAYWKADRRLSREEKQRWEECPSLWTLWSIGDMQPAHESDKGWGETREMWWEAGEGVGPPEA